MFFVFMEKYQSVLWRSGGSDKRWCAKISF